MSTAPTVTATTGTPHPSWYAKAATWFIGIGRAIKNGLLKAAGEEPKIDAAIKQVAPTVEALSNMLLPGSGAFEQHVLDVWGIVAKGVEDAGSAAGANGVNVLLDQTVVNDVKGFLPAVKAHMSPAATPDAPVTTK